MIFNSVLTWAVRQNRQLYVFVSEEAGIKKGTKETLRYVVPPAGSCRSADSSVASSSVEAGQG